MYEVGYTLANRVGLTWIDQQTAPAVPSIFAATGLSILALDLDVKKGSQGSRRRYQRRRRFSRLWCEVQVALSSDTPMVVEPTCRDLDSDSRSRQLGPNCP